MGRPWRPDAPQVQQRTPPAGELLAELLDADFRHQNIELDGGGTLLSTRNYFFSSHELTAAPAESAVSFARIAGRGWLHYRAATAAAAVAGSGIGCRQRQARWRRVFGSLMHAENIRPYLPLEMI